jgi:anti-anti-sigma factor
MELSCERQGSRLRVRAVGDMTIYAAADLKPALLDVLGQGDDIEIDLSEVGELDTSGVQLLMLAKREAAAAGKALTLSRHSPAVLEVFELLGLGRWFGDPQVLPAGGAA